jgi:Zn-dependent peptidase ImmA (M78 family)
VRRKQDWYKEYLQAEGASPRAFVGSLNDESDPLVIANAMQEGLGVSPQLRKEASSWSDYIRRLVSKVEEAGILVFRSGIVGSNTRRKLDVQELRGLALGDPIAPAIFVNSADAKAAQVFTIAHELAHLWIGQTGVSDISPDTDAKEVSERVEIICNNAAAEFLVPKEEFLEKWQKPASVNTVLQETAREFRVSTVMVLRRAYDLGQITRESYFEQLEVERKRQSEPRQEQSGGDFRRNLIARNSRLLVNAVFESVLSGRSLYREAATVLEVKSSTLSGMAVDFSFSKF